MDSRNFEKEMGGQYWLERSLWNTQASLARGAETLVLLNTAITEGSLSPSASTILGSTIAWTQAMVDAYGALLPSSFASSATFTSDAPAPKVGMSSKLPDFVYSDVASSDTDNYGTYAKMVSIPIAASNSLADSGASETRIFYWSDDLTKFKFVRSLTQTTSGTTTTTAQTWVAYDSSASDMAAGLKDGDGTMSLELKADSTATSTLGTYITYDATINSGDDPLVADGTLTIVCDGYAADDGGTIEDTITVTASSGATTVYYLKESFGSTGALTAVTYSSDGTTWTTLSGSNTATDLLYSSKLGAFHGTSLGNNLVDHDMRGHDVQGCGNLYVIENSGITAGVWVAASDSAFTAIIGTGVASAGTLRLTFTAVPASGATFYVAPMGGSGSVDATKAISLTYSSSD